MDDLVIRGATVIDGSGTAGRMTDVAVRDGRISAIGPRRSDSARREIDATGRVLAPGFIARPSPAAPAQPKSRNCRQLQS